MEFSSYFPLWNKISAARQQLLQESAILRRAETGTIIHNGDTNCTGLILVASGQLRVYTISEEGREITLYRLLERDMCLLSASCIIHSIQFGITIEAETDTQFWLIPPEIYKRLMEESAAIANYTNELMASRFSDVMRLMDQVLWKSFDKRLAAFLLNEAAAWGTDHLRITHEQIGRHMGNPREVVTRMLKYFQKEGLVRLSRGSVELTDRNALGKLAG